MEMKNSRFQIKERHSNGKPLIQEVINDTLLCPMHNKLHVIVILETFITTGHL
jgi:hypothetical protein